MGVANGFFRRASTPVQRWEIAFRLQAGSDSGALIVFDSPSKQYKVALLLET